MAFRGRSILKARLVVIGGVGVRGAIRLIAVQRSVLSVLPLLRRLVVNGSHSDPLIPGCGRSRNDASLGR